MKVPRAYEHVDPLLVGNDRKFVISELSGTANLVSYLQGIGIVVDKKDERLKKSLNKIKELEAKGYSFDVGPASAILITLKELNMYTNYINLEYWKVINENNGLSIGIVKVNSQLEVAEGVGPVNAIDRALRMALQRVYPEIGEVKLIDYRVILPSEVKNTESVVRVTIEFTDNKMNWRTEGVSKKRCGSLSHALVDGLDYYLQLKKTLKTSADNYIA